MAIEKSLLSPIKYVQNLSFLNTSIFGYIIFFIIGYFLGILSNILYKITTRRYIKIFKKHNLDINYDILKANTLILLQVLIMLIIFSFCIVEDSISLKLALSSLVGLIVYDYFKIEFKHISWGNIKYVRKIFSEYENEIK